ncbi:hypothetical protein NADFUDRAFT_22365 [Nadsonia fulvescens var. elongata DSM 6958]|uniref:Prolyl 4-hydroxylase alpha subunit domain-containing protein n=1 Tax=Nadsonia fulvescens var. elongata DSM 6958 TaxID=857566 RepID=A0A1E3PQ21_9ASCO|nr:hypothetical protein NADFUDRAFT_22365 [Nadsonia fulvescens var. elongata DSM 6958]
MAKGLNKSEKLRGGLKTASPTYVWPATFCQSKPRAPQFGQVQSYADKQVYVVDSFLNDRVCNDLINWFTAKERGQPTATPVVLETTPLLKSKDYAARVNDRAAMLDHIASRHLWSLLKPLLETPKSDYETYYDNADEVENEDEEESFPHEFKECIGLNPQLRVYRYIKGHFFKGHYDESVNVEIETPMPPGNTKIALQRGYTKWTLLVYLSGGESELKGGETIFYPPTTTGRTAANNAIKINPKKGAALLHKHGDDCLFHEGAMVTEGAKWILRSDLVWYDKKK